MNGRAAARAALAAVVALACAPACAAAHAIVRPAGEIISFTSPDATSTNTLTVRTAGAQIEFHDPTVDGGIDPGDCTAGELSGPGVFGYVVIQAFCPAAGVQAVSIDLGARDDTATISLAIPAVISAGPGADRISSGTGDDDIRVRDGIRDIVRCGTGSDTVDADTLDEIDADCEGVTRTVTAAPAAATPADRGAPLARSEAPARQRIGRSRRIRVYARSTEPGFAAASGTLNLAGVRVPLKVVRREITAPNRRVALTVTLTQPHWRRALRSLRRGGRVTARISVVVTDRAGNSRRANALTVRLVH